MLEEADHMHYRTQSAEQCVKTAVSTVCRQRTETEANPTTAGTARRQCRRLNMRARRLTSRAARPAS